MLSGLLAVLIGASLLAPDQGSNLLPEGPWGIVRPDEAALRVEPIRLDAAVGGTTEALRLTVVRRTDPFYHLQVFKNVPRAIADGTRVRLSFYARSRTGNPVRAVAEKVGPPYTSAAELRVQLTPEWKQYSVTGTSVAFPANGMGVRLQVGHQEGEIEIAAVRLEDLGPDPVMARARAAIQPDAIEKRIRQHRTGLLRVLVKDASGKPVPNASVKVRQTDHAFLFGCNIFGLDLANTSEPQRLYRERFKALLNYGTLPFYWGFYEPRKGDTLEERLTAMARWCRENGIMTKGHPLVWHEVYPGWAPSDPDKAIPLLEARVRTIIPRFKGLIPYWDVLNEANNAADYAQTGEGAWIKRDGPAKVVATALKWAREASAGTGNVLLYNDFNTGEANVRLLEQLKAMNSLPDAIGIQSHMHGGTWPLEQVWATAERFAVFGKPVHFTEVTVVSGPRKEGQPPVWETTPEGERAQADYVERFYSLLFSHPAVQAITWWDFSDQNAWQQAPAGFLRKDMSPKPVYDRLMGLIKGKWWTKADVRTGADGTASTRAFYGTYDIEVRDARGRSIKRQVRFPMGRKSLTVSLNIQ
jgi:GH35 family endo-1,4-beta-xylanase